MYKSSSQDNRRAYHSINRVLQQSHCSQSQFFQGLLFRTLERCFEILPFFICYIWLISVVNIPLNDASLDANYQYCDISSLQDTLQFFIFSLLIFFICQLIFSYLGQRQSFLGSYKIIKTYRQNLIDKVRQLPLGTLSRYRSGQLADILTDDIKRVESIFTHLAADLFSAIATPIILLIMLIFIDWKLAFVLVIGVPFAWLFSALVR